MLHHLISYFLLQGYSSAWASVSLQLQSHSKKKQSWYFRLAMRLIFPRRGIHEEQYRWFLAGHGKEHPDFIFVCGFCHVFVQRCRKTGFERPSICKRVRTVSWAKTGHPNNISLKIPSIALVPIFLLQWSCGKETKILYGAVRTCKHNLKVKSMNLQI